MSIETSKVSDLISKAPDYSKQYLRNFEKFPVLLDEFNAVDFLLKNTVPDKILNPIDRRPEIKTYLEQLRPLLIKPSETTDPRLKKRWRLAQRATGLSMLPLKMWNCESVISGSLITNKPTKADLDITFFFPQDYIFGKLLKDWETIIDRLSKHTNADHFFVSLGRWKRLTNKIKDNSFTNHLEFFEHLSLTDSASFIFYGYPMGIQSPNFFARMQKDAMKIAKEPITGAIISSNLEFLVNKLTQTYSKAE